MKRIFLFFAMMLTLTAISQTQNLTGTKTFTSPPKFKNLQNNNANTKVLTVNSTDVLQWKDANTIGVSEAPINGSNYVRNNGAWVVNTSTTPTLQSILNNSGVFESFTDGTNSENKGLDFQYDGLTTNYRSRLTAYDGLLIGNIGGGKSNVRIQNNLISIYGGTGTNGIFLRSSSNYRDFVTNLYAPPTSGILVAVTENNTEPSTPNTLGKIGEIRVTSNYIYVCIANNTWVRSAASSW